MTWLKQDNYHIKNGAYTICKIQIHGKFTYELWNGKTFIARGDLKTMKYKHSVEVMKDKHREVKDEL